MQTQTIFSTLNWNHNFPFDDELKVKHSLRIRRSISDLTKASSEDQSQKRQILDLMESLNGDQVSSPTIYQQVILNYRGQSTVSKIFEVMEKEQQRPITSQFNVEFKGYAAKGQKMVWDKVIKALRTLKKIAPGTLDFINCYVAKMVFSLQDGCVTSNSNIQLVGQIEISNVHYRKMTEHLLISTLIHEAIHNYLYLHEEELRFMTRPSASIKASSPWTGNPICLHSFVHACYVWYSLDRFWRNILKQDTFSPWYEPSQELFIKVKKGFLNPDFDQLLSKHIDEIRPDILSEISAMKAELVADIGVLR